MNEMIGSTQPNFLDDPVKKHFIDGCWSPPTKGGSIDTYSPVNGRIIASLARGCALDVDTAVAAAQKAFIGPWSEYSPAQRQALLINIHNIIEKNFDELLLLESLDMGLPVSRGNAIKDRLLDMILYFAGQTMNCQGETIENSLSGSFTTLTLKSPIGVVGGIIPWNAPLSGQWWVLGGVLATGCTAVLKPAEDASLSVLRTAELLQLAGVPDGVVNVVTGLGSEAGAALAEHPSVSKIAFTGSTVTGRKIIHASAGNIKRISLELGGKSPDIVFADADLNKAVPQVAMGVFNNTGQICYAGTRVFVKRSIQEEFLEKVYTYCHSLKIGNPLNPEVHMGPVISQAQLDRVMDYISIGKHEGAELVFGGNRLVGDLASGYYIEPTIFRNVNNDMRIAREEIFGPVMSIIPFDTVDEALQLANDTEYGLGGAVWTKNIKTAMKMMHGIHAGQVWINCYGIVDPSVGFSGLKHSGYGLKGGSQHVEEYLYRKSVTINNE